jgi:hypothetical protein
VGEIKTNFTTGLARASPDFQKKMKTSKKGKQARRRKKKPGHSSQDVSPPSSNQNAAIENSSTVNTATLVKATGDPLP